MVQTQFCSAWGVFNYPDKVIREAIVLLEEFKNTNMGDMEGMIISHERTQASWIALPQGMIKSQLGCCN
jgi:hypothetical protein